MHQTFYSNLFWRGVTAIGVNQFFDYFQRRTEKEKKDLMTFEEMRLRLANRDQIREKQEAEERAEEAREMELEARHRREVLFKICFDGKFNYEISCKEVQ